MKTIEQIQFEHDMEIFVDMYEEITKRRTEIQKPSEKDFDTIKKALEEYNHSTT